MKGSGTAVQNRTNILILLLAPAPSVLYYLYCSRGCNDFNAKSFQLCRSCNLHPLALLNALFFVNVCGAFWVLGLLQRSTWVGNRPLLYICTRLQRVRDILHQQYAMFHMRRCCECFAAVKVPVEELMKKTGVHAAD